MNDKKCLKTLGILAGITAASVAAIKPRTSNEEIDDKWQYIEQFKYAHRGLYDQPHSASEKPNPNADEPYWYEDCIGFGRQVIPENSILAFTRATNNGFGVELDVHLTRDNQLAVCHDSNLLRMTGVDVEIENLSYEELQAYPLLATDETIPLLKDVLPIFEEKGLPVIIELKAARDNVLRLCRKTYEVAEASGCIYCVESFDPRCVQYFKLHHPQIVRGQLSQNYLNKDATGPTSLTLKVLLTTLTTNCLTKPDFIAYKYEDRHNPFMWVAKNLYNAKTVSWTLRSHEQLAKAEVEGAIPIFEKLKPKN